MSFISFLWVCLSFVSTQNASLSGHRKWSKIILSAPGKVSAFPPPSGGLHTDTAPYCLGSFPGLSTSTMKVLVVVVCCALFFHGVYPLEEDLDEIQREEDRLPHYLKDDGIRRVAKLTKDHFNKTLKASRMLVVLFYYSGKDDPGADSSWKTDEKMLEVSHYVHRLRTRWAQNLSTSGHANRRS